MKRISIMVVDDHAFIREALLALLNKQDNFEVIAVTGDADRVVNLVLDKIPDILMLDINMSPVSGFEVIQLLRKKSPYTKVIALSMYSQPAYVKKMLKLGAKGYLTKNSTGAEMTEAVNQVNAGHIYICDEVKNLLAEQELDDDDNKVDLSLLSHREIQVIKLLKLGQSSKEISMELEITQKTVEIHRHHILKKLKMKNTISVISYLNAFALDF